MFSRIKSSNTPIVTQITTDTASVKPLIINTNEQHFLEQQYFAMLKKIGQKWNMIVHAV